MRLANADKRLHLKDIKPDNVFVNCDKMAGDATEIKRVQIGDLARLGNPMWRSPESHAAARVNLPSDIFSFGLVVSTDPCFHAMTA